MKMLLAALSMCVLIAAAAPVAQAHVAVGPNVDDCSDTGDAFHLHINTTQASQSCFECYACGYEGEPARLDD